MTDSTLLAIVRGLAYVAIGAGAAGMLYTMPFLWSGQMEDLVGAGFPFVGASIVLVGGLIAMALTLRSEATPREEPVVERRQLARETAQLMEARKALEAARERIEFEERATRANIRRSE
ncbi:MAG: hypothetical protein AAF791_01180 [Bacteroidota bacterium]